MKCLQCRNVKFEKKKMRFSPEIKGEVIEVIAEAFVCLKCATPFMDAEQMNGLRKIAADFYRQKYGMLTSSDILHFREHLKMSQTEFANYLNVGEASIKRWETYYVQDI